MKDTSFIKYFGISVFITIVDVLISRLGELVLPILWSNTLGVITGFVIQYFLTTRYVFKNKHFSAFFVFFVTFIIGLVLANFIVYICRTILFASYSETWQFLLSKGFSIAIPFFVMYYLRKKFMPETTNEISDLGN